VYEIRELQSKIGTCSKAVFLGDSMKYLVYPGQESNAADTVRMSNKMISDAQKRAQAASHV
jgi:hypothetical protein